MDRCCLFTLIFYLIPFGCICAARHQYGTISVVGPAFLNREVTLKATPFYPWGCEVEWRYIMDGNTIFQTMNGTDVNRYSEDGLFFLKWKASSKYNGSNFYAECSSNQTIKTPMTFLNITDINGQCGALVILSPVVRGAEVKLGYFPSDQSLNDKTYATRTWKREIQMLQLRNGSYEEEIFSDYLYILTIFNFKETFESWYLMCSAGGYTNSVQLHISESPSYPVLGPKSPDFITTECIYVYGGSDVTCKTKNGTEPVQVLLLIGHDQFVLSESEGNNGSYRFHNANQQMAGLSRQNVTCQVSNSALETPYQVHGTLCNVVKGNPPTLTVPEFLDGESSTTTCEVRDAIPAPVIKLHVGTVLLADVQQTDSFNGFSHTYTSRAKMTKTNTTWNGKEMCCTSKHTFGLKKMSICQNISMKYPPSEISMSVKKIHSYNNTFYICLLNISCETNESNPPCTIEWASDTENLKYDRVDNWTIGDSVNFHSVSNALYKVTKGIAGGTITCSTRCDHFQTQLNTNYTVLFPGGPSLYFNTTSPVDLRPNIPVTVNCLVDDCDYHGQWALQWEDQNDTIIKNRNKTEECLLTLNYTRDGENIYICNAKKSKELLKNSLIVLSSRTHGSTFQENDTQTFSSTYRFPLNSILIGTGVFCGLGILFIIVIGRCVFLKWRKVNEINIIETVENQSDTSSDNGVLHIATEGVQYAVVQRRAAARRTETQQPHYDDSLTYAELDITFLQEANGRVLARKTNTPTEYADIQFSSAQ